MITKSKISLVVIISILIYIVFNLSKWDKKHILQWDEAGYYLYLPATIIYHDIGHLSFYPKIIQTYYINNGVQNYGLYDEPTGYKLNKYTAGTSVFYLPFFLCAHWYCILHPNGFPADGYSKPYMIALVFGTLFWVLAGLFVLRRFLLAYFSEGATAITLLLLAFATNLYFYTVFDIGMSHPLSFALFCFLLYATDKWYSNERIINVLLLGLIMGLIVITRPTNIVVVIIPLCWKYKKGILADKLRFYKKQLWPILCSFLVFVLVLLIQCSYWKYITGKWVYFSYEGEGFNFLAPEIYNGLFSYRKGWFVYTPVALIGATGLIVLFRKYKRLAAVILFYMAVNIYVVFSWRTWPYGSSFGARALIESMAVVAIPLTMLTDRVFSRKNILLNVLLLMVFGFFTALNLFQSYQLFQNKIVWDGTNKAFYWRTFGRLDVTEEDRKLLYK